jgi:dipeptidyl aminopeptidase/acylaminoacyl peptidase
MMKKIIIGLLAISIIISSSFLVGRYKVMQTEEKKISHTDLIPRSVLFGNPHRVGPQISPDGRKLAYVAPSHDGVLNIWVRSLISGKDDQIITHDTHRGIRDYMWLFDNEHIIYKQDKNGDENTRLFKVNIVTGDVIALTPEGIKAGIIKYDKSQPNYALITMNQEDPRMHDVYKLNFNTGELIRVQKNWGDVIAWYADTDLQVRGATKVLNDGSQEFWFCNTPSDDMHQWHRVIAWPFEDADNAGFLGFNQNCTALYCADTRNTDTAALIEYLIADGTCKQLVHDVTYDASDILVHPDTKKPIAATVAGERKQITLLDQAYKNDFDYLQSLDTGELHIINYDASFNHWIVAYEKDNGPVAYYWYDRIQKNAKFLFYNRDDLSQYTLALMEPITFNARDGLTIRGYLTRPINMYKAVPLVLLVHGGPWARDEWGYDPQAQWFANRGYACLQVNYRGSTGYGKRFSNAGNKEWGRKMHFDLVDAIAWAVNQGIADPKKVAIFGGSYGGYAALVGATETPDLFTCAVDIVGPSNLITLINSFPAYWQAMKGRFARQVGDIETERDLLIERSPLFKADRIKIPLLIAQGANDPRVKQAESDQIVAALEKHNIPHEYMLFEDEGHGFARPENRMKFYAFAEQFLAQYLGGHCEK